jgi:hypothetical protein
MEGENLEKLSNNNFVKVKSGFRVYYIIISIVILLVIGLSILYYIKYTQQQTQIQLFNNQMTKLNINVENGNRYINLPSSITKTQSQWDSYYNSSINKINNLSIELENTSPSSEIYSQQNISIFNTYKSEWSSYLVYLEEYTQVQMSGTNTEFSIRNDKANGLSSLNRDQNYLNQQETQLNQLYKKLNSMNQQVYIDKTNWNKVKNNYIPVFDILF